MKGIAIASTLCCALFLVPHASHAALVLHYDFDEASSGTVAADDHGIAPAASGTFGGGATRTSNTPGSASIGALDAVVDGWVSGGDADKLDSLSAGTFTAWINLQGAPANGNRIMAKQLPSGNFDGFSFAFSTPNAGTIGADNFALNLALGGSSFGFNRSTTDLNADNRWIFVAATYDGATQSVEFYSGDLTTAPVALGSSVLAGTNPASLTANANEFRVAATTTVSAPVLIDDVRVYDTVLSLAELNAVRSANVPEPVAVTLLAMGGVLLSLIRRR